MLIIFVKVVTILHLVHFTVTEMPVQNYLSITCNIYENILKLINHIHELQATVNQTHQQLSEIELYFYSLLDYIDRIHGILFHILYKPTITNCTHER